MHFKRLSDLCFLCEAAELKENGVNDEKAIFKQNSQIKDR